MIFPTLNNMHEEKKWVLTLIVEEFNSCLLVSRNISMQTLEHGQNVARTHRENTQFNSWVHFGEQFIVAPSDT